MGWHAWAGSPSPWRALKRGHELAAQRPGWTYPSAAWVRRAERLVALEARLPAFLEGKFQPGDTAERLDLAFVCRAKKIHHAAAGTSVRGRLRRRPQTGRLPAAPGTVTTPPALRAPWPPPTKGEDAAKLDDKERSRMRQQARDWLGADLAAHARLIASGPSNARPFVQQTLQHWQQNSDLASLREPVALANLATEERAALTRLWADVAALLKQAGPPQGKLLGPVHEVGKGLQPCRQGPTG